MKTAAKFRSKSLLSRRASCLMNTFLKINFVVMNYKDNKNLQQKNLEFLFCLVVQTIELNLLLSIFHLYGV